jgi:hypothetical protein
MSDLPLTLPPNPNIVELEMLLLLHVKQNRPTAEESAVHWTIHEAGVGMERRL